MARPPLNKEIIKFMKSKPEYVWFRKVSLYSQFEDWSPETIGRTLRDLEEQGKLNVGYYDGKYAKGLAQYKLTERQAPKQVIEQYEVKLSPFYLENGMVRINYK